MIDDKIVYVAQENCDRLDKFLSTYCDLTRNHAQKLLADGDVLVNGQVCEKASKKIVIGDMIEVFLPEAVVLEVLPQNIPIDIVYQDDDLAVINKEQGISVHPANGQNTNTLVNALMYHLDNLSQINGVIRPGIVHRLDKDTSGLLVVAKNDKAHVSLAKQIQEKTCKRHYVAVLEGVLKQDDGIVDQPIARCKADRQKMAIDRNGRVAQTLFKVIERYKNNTLCEFELKTGRTHQIRVHAKYLGHPVVGDKKYGYKNQRFALDGQLLHAKKLEFIHPTTGKFMSFEAKNPDYFEKVVQILRKDLYKQ